MAGLFLGSIIPSENKMSPLQLRVLRALPAVQECDPSWGGGAVIGALEEQAVLRPSLLEHHILVGESYSMQSQTSLLPAPRL